MNIPDIWGYTALNRASNLGHDRIVAELCRHTDIQINERDRRGSTALINAAKKGHFGVVTDLLKKKGQYCILNSFYEGFYVQ